MTTPCPICHAPYGFHDEATHAAVVVPRELVTFETATEKKRQKQAEKHRRNREWLEDGG